MGERGALFRGITISARLIFKKGGMGNFASHVKGKMQSRDRFSTKEKSPPIFPVIQSVQKVL